MTCYWIGVQGNHTKPSRQDFGNSAASLNRGSEHTFVEPTRIDNRQQALQLPIGLITLQLLPRKVLIHHQDVTIVMALKTWSLPNTC